METLLLGVTVVSLIIALVMSVSAWRLSREEQRRAAARVAALSVAAGVSGPASVAEAEPRRAPWAPAGRAEVRPYPELPPFEEPASDVPNSRPFLATTSTTYASAGRQRALAVAATVLFVGLSLGVVWTMSGPRGSTPRAMGPNNPLELISLRHERQATKLAISGLVRNPVSGVPVEHLSAVVFLFDPAGAFLASSRTAVDFVTLGVGDETPFVVTLDAPANVARYRVSFRTDAGIVPHIDRRGAPPVVQTGELPVSVTLK